MFHGWPLIKDLFEGEKWPELRQLFERMQGQDFTHCQLSFACFGAKKSVYRTKEALLQDVFPEVYQEEQGQ